MLFIDAASDTQNDFFKRFYLSRLRRFADMYFTCSADANRGHGHANTIAYILAYL